jgi:hypothetical protein
MLFDLRGRGRRRTVQAIYLTLAILMGGGLVLFGIGGSVSGGLLDGIGLTSGGGGQTGNPLEKREQTLERRVRANPRAAAAWAELARTRFQLAGQGQNYNQQTGAFTTAGKRELRGAEQAWDRYLALEPAKPDPNVAILLLRVFGPDGLNKPEKGVRAAEIVSDAQPSSQSFFQLAVFAYAAGQTRKGDLAATKAVELTPPDQRPSVKSTVDQVKEQGGFQGPQPGVPGPGSN